MLKWLFLVLQSLAVPSKSAHLLLCASSDNKYVLVFSHLSSLVYNLSIRLLGNIVGIDEKVAVDGNDIIEKTSFKLSPAAARVSSSAPKTKKKPAQKAKPSSPRKRLFNSHQSSVSEVSDLRLHKRGRTSKDTKKEEDCIVVDSDSDIEDPQSLNERDQKKNGSKTVTPSPHPSRRQSHHHQQQPSNAPAPLYNSSQSSSQQGKKSSHFANKSSGKSRAVRNTTSSWFQQKKQQQTSQSSAFNSPKENPFSTYSFDPNSIEKNLDSQAVRSKEPSIFPSTVAASNFTATKARNNRTFRTPANRRKNSSSSSRISSHDLLARKADELNQHRHQMMTTTGYNGNHDGASQMSAFTAGNGFTQEHSFENHEHDYFASSGSVTTSYQQQFGQPSSVGGYGQFMQPRPGTAGTRVQHFMQPQQEQRSFQPQLYEGSFDEGYSCSGYDFPTRPGTSSSRFMNMPYQQEFVPPRSVGGYDIPPRRPGTSSSRFTQQQQIQQQFVQPQQSSFQPMYHEDSFDQFSQQHHGQPQLNRFESNFHHDGVGQVREQFSQQVSQMRRPIPAQAGMSSIQNGHTSGAPGQNPYLQQESSCTAGSVVNPYRRRTQDANSGPPAPMHFSHSSNYNAAHVGMSSSMPVQNPYLQNGGHRAAGSVMNNPYMRQDANSSGPPMKEVVVEAMHDETTSQFEDAFF